MSGSASPPKAEETLARYEPANGGDRITLAVLRSEVVHGFRHINTQLLAIEKWQQEQGKRLSDLETFVAVLNATALKLSAIKLSAILGAAITIVFGLATVITKVAGLW